MTINTTTRTAGPFIGAGTTTVFPFTFKVFSAADIAAVQTISTSGVSTTLTQGTGYAVSVSANQNVSPGGSVMLSTALPTGSTLVLTSTIAILQPTDLTNNGGFYPSVITNALDRLTIICQQLFSTSARSLRVPVVDIAVPTELPSAVARANNLLGFDSAGNPVAVAPAAQSATALQALVSASYGAGLVGFVQLGTGAVATTVQSKLRECISVKNFGAKGDGVTDDTAAFNLAATALQNYQSLYVPAGEYIADIACILFRGKTHIDIYGDGEATRIHPSAQGVSPSKVDYHTTFAIDQCSFVTVRDMVIESKGESYGNADAYGGLVGGDPRTNALIANGGHAVLVTRSDHVTLTNITSRFCGSVGVVYLSSCEEVVLENCFANAASLGYAGFAIDNWADSVVKNKRTYKLINCRVSKETYTYSAKAGIASEGDQTTGRLINLDVIGGIYEDCAIGGDAPYLGTAVSCFETRLTMRSVVTKNCYSGLSWQKRGGAVDFSWAYVSNCNFINNTVTGAYIAIGTATGGSAVEFSNTTIVTAASSQWSALSATWPAFSQSTGITVAGFTSGVIRVNGVTITGAQHGLYAIDSATFNVAGGFIETLTGGITMYGGGSLTATGVNIKTSGAGSKPVFMTTANLAATASFNSNLFLTGNILEAPTGSDLVVQLTGSSALFLSTLMKSNSVKKGTYSVSKGSATFFDVDTPQTWIPVVSGDVIAGAYELDGTTTRCTYVKNGNLVTVNAYIVFAGAVTGGGTGSLKVTGVPYPKRVDSSAWGAIAFSSLDYSATKQVSVYFGGTGVSSALLFWETSDVSAVTLVPVSAVAAGRAMAFSISYEVQ